MWTEEDILINRSAEEDADTVLNTNYRIDLQRVGSDLNPDILREDYEIRNDN